jgi:hypothetical protein
MLRCALRALAAARSGKKCVSSDSGGVTSA